MFVFYYSTRSYRLCRVLETLYRTFRQCSHFRL